MRIAICGSHGTGKTTLLKKILSKKEYKDYFRGNIISEISRSTIEKTGFNPKEGSGLERLVFQSILFQEQLIKEKTLENFISDRSLFDVIAYTKSLIKDDILSEKEKVFGEILVKQMEEEVSFHLIENPYHYLFYLPVEFEIEDDGVRFTHKEYQLEIDSLIKESIKKTGIYFNKLTGSIENRFHQFDEEVSFFI